MPVTDVTIGTGDTDILAAADVRGRPPILLNAGDATITLTFGSDTDTFALQPGQMIQAKADQDVTGTVAVGTEILQILEGISPVSPRPRRDRAYLGLAGIQDGVATDDHVEWDASSILGSMISLSAGAAQLAGIITLKTGPTYRIGIGIGMDFDANTAHVGVIVYNRTLAAKLIPDGGALDPRMFLLAPAATVTNASQPTLFFEFTPAADTDIDVRFEAAGGGGVIDFIRKSTWMTIDALP